MKDLAALSYPRLKRIELGVDGGAFKFRHKGRNYNIIASFGGGWDHVSVDEDGVTPSWEMMELIKEIFFNDDEVCYEFHPAKSNYVNVHHGVLHIWKKQGFEIPMPPIEMV
ncbi:hypothetical protein ACNAN0_02390 [Agrilactobacillus fermenti]|uniref:DUF7694 domain-containing protein n=1 Tax=Agrilactobacillus fermenti TaxID=2586909 RepID=UPI003A5BA8EB